MKKRLIYLCFIILSVFIFGCAQEQVGESKTLAKINEYVLPLDEFQIQLAEELNLDREFKLTNEAKKDFLDQLIIQEILIQEAKKQQLDRRKKFMRTIERYWESTLIRDLMEVEGKKIEERTVISQEEIEMTYNEMKKIEENLPPLDSINDEISKKIMEDKKSKMLKEWIDQLKAKAKIEINQDLLLKK